jgi:regulator of cell morphogenesis and NO signaling
VVIKNCLPEMIRLNDTFSEIISQNKYLSSIFERFGIGENDYHKTIEEAGKEKNTDPHFMIAILNAFDQDNKPDIKVLMHYPISTILDYLKKSHRYYLDKKIPEIELSLKDIVRTSHQGNQMMYTLGNLFIAYKKKLTEHIVSEEVELFPYIEFIIQQLKNDTIDCYAFGKIHAKFSIQIFEDSHTNVEEDIEKTKHTIMKFSPTQSSAMSYRIFLNQLELFEQDLHRHSIIEDHVLVPKAQLLEDIVKSLADYSEGYIK